MRFRILGPLRVNDDGGEVTLKGRKQRTVLAVLLASAGKIVSWEHLLDAVWDESPPPTARRQIQNCVAELRRQVTGVRIVTDGPGYRIMPGAGELDAAEFARHIARARQLASSGRPAEAAAEYREGLGLWRGPALFGVAGRVVEVVAAGLDEQRLAAIEDCAELELGLGEHGRLVGELTSQVAANPLRERLVGQLMLALHRSDRQADALLAYHRLKDALADELGVDPGAELQRTYTEILTIEPARCGRCYLPRAVPDFVGRQAALTDLTAAAGTPAVLAIGGMAGVGKTTLAVHLAYRMADRYPDAQLHVDLHSHDPGSALSILLHQLGVAADRIPESVDDRTALWRAELAGRHVVVLLDNASGSRQVAPLLAGESDTLVIVTSRRLPAGIDGVHAVSLDAMPESDAVELLGRIVGARVSAAPSDAAELAQLCGHLPLALRLAAARLVRRSTWSVADLNERLRDPPGRLSQLAAEDRAVSAALDLSYQQLDLHARSVFGALGRHGRTGFDRNAAAALAGLDVTAVDGHLEELVDAYLLETPAAGRYRLHDLVHDFASVQPAPPSAQERMLAHYLHTTARATAHFERPVARAALVLDDPPPTVPRFGETRQAVAWLDVNWPTVVAAVSVAGDALAWRIARALWPYLYRNGRNREILETHQLALAAAGRLGDDAAAAAIHSCIAAGYANLKRYDATEHHLRERFAVLRRIGDDRGIVGTLNNLAFLQLYAFGQPGKAVTTCQEAIELAERIGATQDVYLCARTLGIVYRKLGRYDEALASLQRALAGFESAGETSWHSMILGELGSVYAAVGDHATAVSLLRRALDMKRSEGNRTGTTDVLSSLGEAYQALGQATDATECHRSALAMVQDEDHAAAGVFNAYGRTLLAQGDAVGAVAAHRKALALVGEVGNRYEKANAHGGLAAALRPVDPVEAEVHRQQALEIYEDMGAVVAGRIPS